MGTYQAHRSNAALAAEISSAWESGLRSKRTPSGASAGSVGPPVYSSLAVSGLIRAISRTSSVPRISGMTTSEISRSIGGFFLIISSA